MSSYRSSVGTSVFGETITLVPSAANTECAVQSCRLSSVTESEQGSCAVLGVGHARECPIAAGELIGLLEAPSWPPAVIRAETEVLGLRRFALFVEWRIVMAGLGVGLCLIFLGEGFGQIPATIGTPIGRVIVFAAVCIVPLAEWRRKERLRKRNHRP